MSEQSTTADAERGTKRARTEGPDEDTASNDTTKNSEKSWFEDGNIILQVEKTLFRVHRGVLARHSLVFRDLFALPQPSTGELVIEGCPVVSLPGDKKEDWENVFTLIYDHETDYKDENDFKLPILTSMLRLGRKYQLDVIYKAAITRIKPVVPTTLEEWTKLKSCPNHLTKKANNAFDLLSIVVELGTQKFMPVLFYYCVSEFELEKIVEQYNSIANPKLPYDCVVKMILGREKLIAAIVKNHLSWTTAASFPPNGKCKSVSANAYHHYTNDLCKPFRANAITKTSSRDVRLALMPGDADFLELFKSEAGPASQRYQLKPCDECANEIMRLQNVYCAWVWENLPLFFGLPKWDTLEPL